MTRPLRETVKRYLFVCLVESSFSKGTACVSRHMFLFWLVIWTFLMYRSSWGFFG